MSLSLFHPQAEPSSFLREHEHSYPLVEQQLLIAVRALRDVCDGARTWDGKGFNKWDAQSGLIQNVATQSYRMTPKQMIPVYWKIIKYAGQLASMGCEIPSLEDVKSLAASRDAVYAERKAAKEAARSVSPDELSGTVDFVAGKLHIKFPYHEEANRRIHGIQEEIDKMRMSVEHARVPRVQWSEAYTAYEAPMQALKLVQAAFPKFEVTQTLRNELRRREAIRLEEERAKAERARALDMRTRATIECLGDLSKPIGRIDDRDITLYAHQKAILYKAIYKLRYIIAHDVGLGKTAVALCAAKAIARYEHEHAGRHVRIIVIGQAVKRADWLKEAAGINVQIEYYNYERIPLVAPTGAFVLIVDEAHHMQALTTQRTKKFLNLSEHAHAVFMLTGSPMGNGQARNIYPLLVAAHHPIAYPIGSKRRSFEREFCAGHATDFSRWDTSGSNAQARLNKLMTTGEDECLEYKEKEECLDLPPLLRYRKTAHISAAARALYKRTAYELWHKYETRVQEKLEEFTRTRQQEHLEEYGEELDVTSEAFMLEIAGKEESIRSSAALVTLGIARHAGEHAKVEATVDQAIEFLESGRRPVIFCEFKDVAEALAVKLSAYVSDVPEEHIAALAPQARPVKVISGDLPKLRESFIKEYQDGKSRAIVCTFSSGGTGINLQNKKSSRMILVSRPWTPKGVTQGEGRTHRIGQEDTNVISVWMQLPGDETQPDYLTDIDIEIDNNLEEKQRNINAILKGEDIETMSRAIVFEPIAMLAHICGRDAA